MTRQARIPVYMTEAEKDEIAEAARLCGIKSLSAFMVMAALQLARREKP